jgi:hypothetical protein
VGVEPTMADLQSGIDGRKATKRQIEGERSTCAVLGPRSSRPRRRLALAAAAIRAAILALVMASGQFNGRHRRRAVV